MAINLNDNIFVNAPKASDQRYGPYTSTAQALSSIPAVTRYVGLTVGIDLPGGVKEYWFKNGTLNSDLIEKTTGSSGGIPVSIIEAKGDIIVGAAIESPSVLPLGNDGEVLTADSAQPLGVKWAPGGGGGGGTGQIITTTFSTSSLSPNSTQTFSIDLGDSVSFISLEVIGTPEDAWVRAYASEAGMLADTRTEPGPPFPSLNSGFSAEIVTSSAQPKVTFSPVPTFYAEGNFFFKFTNLGPNTQVFTLETTYQEMGVSWEPAPTDLSYNESTRFLGSSTGSGVTLPLFSGTRDGLVPLTGGAGGSTHFLRADGIWSTPTQADSLSGNPTINGTVFNGTNNITITASTPSALSAGSFLTASGSFDGSAPITFAVDATSSATPSKVVSRDASGNFSANTITASLTGVASGNLPTAGGTLTGNLTAPAIVVTGSTAPANGVFLPSANTVGIATNGTSKVTIDPTGIVTFNSVGLKFRSNRTIEADIDTSRVVLFGGASAGASLALYGGTHPTNPDLITLDANEIRLRSLGSGQVDVTSTGASVTGDLSVTGDITGFDNVSGGGAVTFSSGGTNQPISITSSGSGSISLTTTGNIQLKPGVNGTRIFNSAGTFYAAFNTELLTNSRTISLPDAGVTLVGGTMVPSSRTLTVTTQDGITGGTAAVDLGASRSWTLGLTGQALALHNLSTNGLITRTGVDTVAARSIAVSGTGVSITNADGVSGNPTISIGSTSSNTPSTIVARDASGNFSAGTITANLTGTASGNIASTRTLTITTQNGLTGGTTALDLSADRSWTLGLTGQALALHNLSTNGLIVRTGSGTVASRSIAVSGTGVSITNADGVAGNPTISIGSTSSNTPSTVVSRDASGNFSANVIGAGSGTEPAPALSVGGTNAGVYSPSAGLLGFSANGAEAFRVDGSNRLLIGTKVSTPALGVGAEAGLQVEGSTSGRRMTLTSLLNSSGGPFLGLGHYRAASGISQGLRSGDELGTLQFSGNDGNSFLSGARVSSTLEANAEFAANELTSGTSYIITFVGTTNFTLLGAASNTVGTTFTANATVGSGTGRAAVASGYMPANLLFSTGLSSGLPVERMRIDSSGRVLIGNTSSIPVFGAGADASFQVSGLTNGRRMALTSLLNGAGGPFLALSHYREGSGTSVGLRTGDELGTLQFTGSDGSSFQSGARVSSTLEANAEFAANELTAGTSYVITFVGTTDFTLLGAASNTVGTTFVANATVGTGTGRAALSSGYMPANLIFSTGLDSGLPAERLRIDSSGRVLIGTSLSTASLGVGGDAGLQVEGLTAGRRMTVTSQLNNTGGAFLGLGHYRVASTTSNGLRSGDELGTIQFSGSDGSKFWGGARISSTLDANAEFAANELTSGSTYIITFVGTTNFTLLGAASNTVGTTFVANATVGTGTGRAALSSGNMPANLVLSTGLSSGTFVDALKIDSAGRFGCNFSGALGGTPGAYRFNTPITGGTSANGMVLSSSVATDVTNTAMGLLVQSNTADGISGLTDLRLFSTGQGVITGGTRGVVVNQYGFYAGGLNGATNNFGFYSVISGASGRWSFYAAGSAPNYFSGDVRTNSNFTQYVAEDNSNSSTLVSAASIRNGLRTGTPTANITLQVPTGTNMEASFQDLQTGHAFEWSVINLAAATFTITVTSNTDHTLRGNMVVSANSSGRFQTRKASTNTFVTYRIA